MDSKDSLFLLRLIRTYIPIRSNITAISTTRSDEFVADLFEGGSDPAAFDSAHATRTDVIVHNLNPNKTYVVGDQPTVLLMPDLTAIVSPFGDTQEENDGQYQGQGLMMIAQNNKGWTYLFAHEML